MDGFFFSILRGLITYSTGIFILLGLGILIYLRKFLAGLAEWQKAVFGLERRLAQRMLISATTGLVLLGLLVFGQFMLVTVIGPQMPATQSETQTASNPGNSPSDERELDEDTEEGAIDSEELDEAMTPPGIEQEGLNSECVEDRVEITSPAEGDNVSGTVEIIGSVNIENFGSYKYEYSSAGSINWVTIAAGNQLKLDERLGYWYTSALDPGNYLLQLVPLNNVGEELASCIISVRVVSEE